MPKSYQVGDTTYQFPDEFDDAKVQGILTKQGVIKSKAPDSFMDKAGQYVKGVTDEGIHEAENLVGLIPGIGGPFKHAAGLDDPKTTEKLFPTPTTGAGRLGKFTTQVGEMLMPIPGLGKVRAAQGAGKLARLGMDALRTGIDVGAKTAAQTGSLKEGAEAGAAGAGVGVAAEAAMSPVGNLLKKFAVAQYGKVLHPLGRNAKEVAMEHIPELLGRGKDAIGMTQEGLNDKFAGKVEDFGKQIESEYQKLDANTRTKLKPIFDDLAAHIDRNAVTGSGTIKDPAVLKAGLAKMGYVQDALGPWLGDARPSTVWEVRRTLDKYVFKNGLTADESVAAGKEITEATGNAIRRALNDQHPTVAALNNEFHLWRSVSELMNRNVKNELGKFQFARGFNATARFAAGAAIGGEAAHEKGSGMWETATAATLMGLAMETTAWRSTSAVTKNKIADLLIAGNGQAAADLAARVTGVGMRLGKSQPAPTQ